MEDAEPLAMSLKSTLSLEKGNKNLESHMDPNNSKEIISSIGEKINFRFKNSNGLSLHLDGIASEKEAEWKEKLEKERKKVRDLKKKIQEYEMNMTILNKDKDALVQLRNANDELMERLKELYLDLPDLNENEGQFSIDNLIGKVDAIVNENHVLIDKILDLQANN